MPNPEFLVYVVESPSAGDLYTGKSEGTIIAQAAKLDKLPCLVRVAIDAKTFREAVTHGLAEAMSQYLERIPILHISAHGTKVGNDFVGITLSNGERLSWDDLRELLVPVNSSLQGCLLLSMSTCGGLQAMQMAMDENKAAMPFFALVGHPECPGWADTAVAYATYYHLLMKGTPPREAAEAMKIASGDKQWATIVASEAQAAFLEEVARINFEEALRVLRTIDPSFVQAK